MTFTKPSPPVFHTRLSISEQ